MNLEQLRQKGASIKQVRDAEDIGADASLIFIEIHPNNPVILKQYAFNLDALLNLFERDSKKHYLGN